MFKHGSRNSSDCIVSTKGSLIIEALGFASRIKFCKFLHLQSSFHFTVNKLTIKSVQWLKPFLDSLLDILIYIEKP